MAASRGVKLGGTVATVGFPNIGLQGFAPKLNYAVKSSYLLSFLESVPEVSAKLKEPETKERRFEEVVKSAEQAAVLVLVY